MAYIISSGVTSGLNLTDETVSVINSGTVINTTLNSKAYMYISSGGQASATKVNRSGVIDISTGGYAFDTRLNSVGSMWVSSGGTANSVTIGSDAIVRDYKGGYVKDVTVSSGGYLDIWIAGASAIYNYAGRVDVSSGASAEFINIYSGGSVNVRSGGTAVSARVQSGGALLISSGGVANHNSVYETGSIKVFSGGFANSNTVNSGGCIYVTGGTLTEARIVNGSMFVSNGGLARDVVVVDSRGIFTVGPGGTADGALVTSKGRMIVSSGGVANGTEMTEGNGYLDVYSGGVLNNTVLSGRAPEGSPEWGATIFLDGGTANNTVLNKSDCILIESGGTANITELVNCAKIVVGAGGAAYNTTANSECFISVIGGFVSNTTLNSGGSMIVSSAHSIDEDSDGLAFDTTLSGGRMIVELNCSAFYTSVYDGQVKVSYGGVADNSLIMGGVVDVLSSGTLTSATIGGGTVNVSTGALANNNLVSAGGHLFISGGIANDTTIEAVEDTDIEMIPGVFLPEGGMAVLSGGTANNTNINSSGAAMALLRGVMSKTNVDAFGRVLVILGGTVTDTTLMAVQTDLNAETFINSGGNLLVENGLAVNTLAWENGYVTIFSGGTAEATRITTWAFLDVSSGGVVTGTTVGGTATIYSGGVANETQFDGGGSMVISGGTANNISAALRDQGTVRILSGGVANNIVAENRFDLFISGGTANGVMFKSSGGRLRVSYGGVVSGTTRYGVVNDAVISGGSMEIGFRANANRTVIAGGVMSAYDEATINDTQVSGKGYMYVNNAGDGLVSGVTVGNIERRETQSGYVYSGGVILKKGVTQAITVESAGYLVLSSYARTSDVTVEDGGEVLVEGGTLSFAEVGNALVEIRNGAASDTTIRGGTMTVQGGSTGLVRVVSGGIMLVSRGRIDSSTLSGGGSMILLSSGASASNTTVDAFGQLYVSQGAAILRTTVNGGYVSVFEHASATSTTVLSGALRLFGKVRVSNTVIEGEGSMTVSSGASADSTTVLSGGVVIAAGSSAVLITTDVSGGALVLSSGAQAREISVSKGGCLYIYDGASVSGHVDVESGGTIVLRGALTPQSESDMFTSGNVAVYAGGKITGVFDVNTTSKVGVRARAIFDFNISELDTGNDYALVRGFSNIDIQNSVNFTLTVDGAQNSGTYKLADSVSAFNSSISVVGSTGETLGTLAVGQTVDIGGADYTLTLADDLLSVTVIAAEPGPEPPGPGPEPSPYVIAGFFPGCFAGGAQAMLGVERLEMTGLALGGMVDIYSGGAAWDGVLTLDPGWEVYGVGDFNADGRDDFLRVNYEGYVVGEMSLTNVVNEDIFVPQVLNFLNPGWSILGTGDFNGNGSDDILIANPTGASETVGLLGYWESGATWTLINGYSAEWECVATGDFNGDGKCDMLWRNSFEGDGGGTYNAYCTWIVEDPVDWRMVSVANPAEWNFLCSGDFDGDKMNDIAMINGEGVVGIWGVEDGWLSSWSILSAVDQSTWTLAGVGDFNADGTDDIAWYNSQTGQVGAWQIENKELASWQTIANLA